MLYSGSYKLCGECGESKLVTDFYKSIGEMCKICRKQHIKEEKRRSKEEWMRSREEYGLTIRLHDMKIKGLDEKVKSQADMTDKMEDEVISLGKEVRRLKKLHLENEVESLREMMKGLMKEVKELNRLKAEMKGYVAAEKVKTSMRIKSK